MPERLRITSQMEGNNIPSSTSSGRVSASSIGAARDMADVALEVGIAANDLQPIARAHDADRQHSGGMNQLSRNVDGHVADDFASRNSFFPASHCAEREVVTADR